MCRLFDGKNCIRSDKECGINKRKTALPTATRSLHFFVCVLLASFGCNFAVEPERAINCFRNVRLHADWLRVMFSSHEIYSLVIFGAHSLGPSRLCRYVCGVYRAWCAIAWPPGTHNTHLLCNFRNAKENRISGHFLCDCKNQYTCPCATFKVITVAVHPENAWHTCSVFQKNVLTFNFVLPCRCCRTETKKYKAH